jgi:DNA-binding NarL/FixJ family response regulator
MEARDTDANLDAAISPMPFAHLPGIGQYLTQGGYDLHVVTALVNHRLKCELNAIGLGADQYAVLNLLANATAIPLEAIHVRLRMDPLPTLGTIRELRRSGFIQIDDTGTTGQRESVRLTSKGRDVLDHAGAITARCNDLLLASLSSEERRVFQLALQQILRQELSQWLVAAAVATPAPRPSSDLAMQAELTPREVEVYRLLRTGKSNRQIADSLGIQLSTTKTHVTRILEKLGACSRAEAAAFPPLALEYARWG